MEKVDCVIIPTYNERGNIRTLTERLFSLYPDIHVLVVDDNSPDGTAGVVRELQERHRNLHLKERPGKQGLGSAYIAAFKEILGAYPELRSITTMDADLSHDPAVIAEMHKEIDRHDLVVGSRYITGGGVKNWELWRRLLSVGGNWYTRLVAMSPIRDLTAGFVCYRAELLKQYDLDSITAAGYGYQMQMKITAAELGARIKEIPILFGPRVEGQSKISNHIIYEGIIVPWRFSPLLRFFGSKRQRDDREPPVIVNCPLDR